MHNYLKRYNFNYTVASSGEVFVFVQRKKLLNWEKHTKRQYIILLEIYQNHLLSNLKMEVYIKHLIIYTVKLQLKKG